jgi:uncharacterized BrkB/YihY/UPF0761 family membrane protein
MKQTIRIPKRLAFTGGILMAASGVVNAVLGIRTGALYYDVYPGGNMGHVGIVAGIGAVVLGLVIIFLVVPLYNKPQRGYIALAGVLTIVLGHLGAVAGAIYVGTVGLLLCYIAGFWALVIALSRAKIAK